MQLKHDKAGLGHDISKNFTNQWWDHVFNKAAAKLSVETDEEGVKVTSNSDLSEKQKEKLKRKVLYGNFVKVSKRITRFLLNFRVYINMIYMSLNNALSATIVGVHSRVWAGNT